jgi:hypothetical protein
VDRFIFNECGLTLGFVRFVPFLCMKVVDSDVDSAGLIPGLLSVLRLKGVLRIMNQLLHRSNLTVQVALCLQKL